MGENYYYITPAHIEKAKANGISYETLKERVYRLGWNVNKACTKPKKKGYPRLYPDWVYEKAKENGLRYNTVNHRIKAGCSLEVACTLKPLKVRERLPR